MSAGTPLDALAARTLGLAEGFDRADLARAQGARLRETFLWARARSRFYRARLAGCAPPRSVEDLAALPFTTAADLAADPLALVCVPQDEIDRVVTLETSGTSGRPKRLFFTAADQEITLAFFRCGLSQMVARGRNVLALLPQGRPGGLGDLLGRALRALGARVRFAEAMPDDDAFRRSPPDLVVGAPVAVLDLARRTGGCAVRAVLLCSDRPPEGAARRLADAWGCETFEDWGMTEMGYGGGVDCRAHDGRHLQEGDFLFEIVDPATGRAVPDGAFGEVTLTTLTRRGMPLIRYRTGDVSRFLPGRCACGSPLRRLDRIAMRSDGRVGPHGGVTLGEIDDALFGVAGVVDVHAGFCAGTPERLRLEVVAPGAAADLETRLAAALGGVASLRAARAEGALALELAVVGGASAPARGKRRLHVEASA